MGEPAHGRRPASTQPEDSQNALADGRVRVPDILPADHGACHDRQPEVEDPEDCHGQDGRRYRGSVADQHGAGGGFDDTDTAGHDRHE